MLRFVVFASYTAVIRIFITQQHTMRILFTLITFITTITVKAQAPLPGGYIDHLQRQSLTAGKQLKDSVPAKKWFVSKWVGISTSFGFFNGGNATMLAVPVGIQLNRRLTNNWYAFAGVSAAPVYTSFNHSFLSSTNTKFQQRNSFLQSNRLDIYSRAELGLMYVNDQKTFSISGSIGIEKSTYPLLPYNQMGIARPNEFIGSNR